MYELLKPVTRELLSEVAAQTGVGIRVAPRHTGYLSQTGLSSYLANPEAGEVTIAYDPTGRSIDYAVAHEALRLKRFFAAPKDERSVLISTGATKAMALSEMLAQYAGPQALYACSLFYDGMLTQLASAPVDPWINTELHDDFPGLRDDLAQGVEEIMEKLRGALREEIAEVTPSVIYLASNAINAHFAAFVGELLGKAEFESAYDGRPAVDLGRELVKLNASDRGHVGDRWTTDEWSKILGLVGWYEWRRVWGQVVP